MKVVKFLFFKNIGEYLSNKKRILVGPIEIANYNKSLCSGFKQLGVPYDFVTHYPHPFDYGGETINPFLLRASRTIGAFRESRVGSKILKRLLLTTEILLQSIWGCIAIFRYDVFLFCFGKTLLPFNLDLPVLTFLGKKVISNIGLGSESRPAYINGAQNAKDGTLASLAQLRIRSKQSKKLVTRHIKFSSFVVGAPLSTSQFSSYSFINWFCVGFPSDAPGKMDKISDCFVKGGVAFSGRRPVRILHSPSHPAVKGTARIQSAIDNLRANGYFIEFVLIHGRPFCDVVYEIKKCDFVVDQVFSDTPMAGFAKEAAWFGRPAVVGGYGIERLREFVSDDMWPPSEVCHPDELERSIERLIVDVDYRYRLGRDAQEFVRSKWSAKQVAHRYLRLIEGDVPKNWWFDPKTVVYVEGAGQSVAQSRENIRGLIQRYGLQSLQLSHRPELEQAFLQFSETGPVRTGKIE